jgi:hypothetical protein
MALVRHAFQLNVTDPARAGALMARAGEVADAAPAYSLRYPKAFHRLASVREAITTTVHGLAP